jgi:hypothetical protein
VSAEKKGLALALVLSLSACADWPVGGAATTGPWPELVPLSSLDLTAPTEAETQTRLAGTPGSAALATRAARLRSLTGASARAATLSARAAILRGAATTEAEREAMRARLAGVTG